MKKRPKRGQGKKDGEKKDGEKEDEEKEDAKDEEKEDENENENEDQEEESLEPAVFVGKKAKKKLKKLQRQAKLKSKLGKTDPEEEQESDETPSKLTTAEKIQDTTEKDKITIIFDDEGNVVGETIDDQEEQQEEAEEIKQQPKPKPQPKKEQQPPKKAKQEPKASPAPSKAEESPEPKSSSDNEQPTTASSEDSESSTPTPTASTKHKADPEKIEQLRTKLASRIQEFKENRKAPGTVTNGAVRTRDAILSARRLREEKEKEKKLKRKREDDEDDDDDDDESDEEDDGIDGSNLMFSSVEFADGSKATANLKEMRHQRSKKGPRDILGQLKHIQAKNAKLAKLSGDKKSEMESKNMWSKAIAQSEGVKIKDDVKKLKTSLKKHQNKKLKKEKEWNERVEATKVDKEKRIAKRNEHIELKIARSKLHGKKAKKRAGFEGGIAKARVRSIKQSTKNSKGKK